ncbi:hypothetical protein PVL29_014316 [Vitis rotundifolia]|uniref:Dynein light chain n=1 Tax=Vitis rotundifolia TaxID=103349 RepID=A0AA38ZH83_VITRO|nr:hypothetical protein PVL29_014316 [Vitis rotundifolia]
MGSHVKKERGLLCVYSSGEGEKKSEERLSVKKQVGRSWGLRKSKTCQENAQYGGERVVEEGGGGGVVVEARKSVSCIETNVSSVAAFLQVKVLVTDMPGFMQVHAFRCARRTFDSLEKFSSKHMAYNIKKEFDKVYGPAWHCIVGSSFGSFVTHSTGGFLYFSMEKLFILVFKTKVQRALDSV